ncbi:MurR/RpiR family transcriptional regulator [Ruegeria sp. EL01]|jgi:DNA-binding MurR/RpiR family transcriptional regulator|uniref:MurR/RpiR family transcriptional regulator n=1 Tax=Ruegeria sp. EL01 TaxID=2107578 RepID=UPI000EA81FB5|nr:MurR/RpiR family transcriptional regulator [Ruegeria sp. EL01]
MSEQSKPTGLPNQTPPLPASKAPPQKGRIGAVDLIPALHNSQTKLAVQEQKVADYVKENLSEISAMTIGDLADRCSVSKPTVVRFCRSLGCEGFRDFKLRLAQNIAVSAQYLYGGTNDQNPDADAAVDQVLGAVFATLDIMRRQINTEKLEAARDACLDRRQILFSGIGGGSSFVAQEASNRFFRLGIPSFFVNDSYVLQMRAAALGPEDVLFLISASGEADAIVGAAEVANGYGATTISITRPDTRLSNVSKISLLTDLPEDSDIYKPTASRYAHLAIVDAFAMVVAQEMTDETKENLRRIRASLTAYHGRTGPQPLGD